MNSNLLNTLVAKKIVDIGTEIEAKYLAPGLDGCHRETVQGVFTISKIALEEDEVTYLYCVRSTDGAKLRTKPEAIVRLDGMEPEVLGQAFDILPDGSMKKIKLDEFGNPVRRGRKPKHLLQGKVNERDNRSKELSSDKAKKSTKGKRRGNSTSAKATRGRKQSNRTTSKRQRDAKANAG